MNQTPRTWPVFVDSDGRLHPYSLPNPCTVIVTELPEGHVVVPESEIDGLNKLVDRYLDKIREMDVTAVKCAAELSYLRRWKAEMMGVTKELDTQAIGHELDLVLGTNVYPAILPGIRRLKRDASFWEGVAAQYARNTEYYRDLLDRVAIYLGDDVFTCDDGSVSDTPLRAKIPELVSALASRASEIESLKSKAAALEKSVEALGQSIIEKELIVEDLNSYIAKLESRIDSAATKLDGALDDLAGEQPSLDELFEQEAARLVADKVFDFVVHGVAEIPVREPETLKIETGGAYLTRGGRMSDRETPETDQQSIRPETAAIAGVGLVVPAAFAGRLERQRNELLETAHDLLKHRPRRGWEGLTIAERVAWDNLEDAVAGLTTDTPTNTVEP